MPIARSVLLINFLQRFCQFQHVSRYAGVQGLADRGLFSARFAPKGKLQRFVRSHPIIDFYHPVSARQNIDKHVLQFVRRAMLNHFLPDLYMLFNLFPDFMLFHPHSQHSQAGMS
jgi:hypothetical protein